MKIGEKCIDCDKSRRKFHSSKIRKILDEKNKTKYSKLFDKNIYIGDFICKDCP